MAEPTDKKTAAATDTPADDDYIGSVVGALGDGDLQTPDAKTDDKKPDPPKTPPKQDTKASPLDKLIKTDDPKTDDKPAGDDTLDVEEAIKGMSVKAADKFKAIHQRAKAAEEKAANIEKQLKTQIETLKKAGGSTEDVEALKTQLKELDSLVKKTALTEHPEFRQKFDGRKEQQIKLARMAVGPKLADEIEGLLRAGDTPQRAKRMDEISEELGAFKANKLMLIASGIDQIDFEKQEALQNWEQERKNYFKEQQQQAQTIRNGTLKQLEDAARSVIDEVTDEDKGIEIFRTIDGEDEWNEQVKHRIEEVRKLTTSNLEPPDIAQMAMQSVAARQYRTLFLESYKENRALKAQLAKLKGAGPSMDTNRDAGKAGETDDGLSYLDAVERLGRESGLLR